MQDHKPSKIEVERRRRIRLSVAAYAYEFHSDSIISDAEFDKLSEQIDKNVKTGHRILDRFFKKNFEPCTGMWVQKHPDKAGLEWIYKNVFKREQPVNVRQRPPKKQSTALDDWLQ